MTTKAELIGDWVIRRGDRLPQLAFVVENDFGQPVDLTGAKVYLMLRHEDGIEVMDRAVTGLEQEAGDWLVLEAYIQNPPAGIVVYDWPQGQTSAFRPGVMQMAVSVAWPDGAGGGLGPGGPRQLTAPTDRIARLIVRPTLLVGVPAPPA